MLIELIPHTPEEAKEKLLMRLKKMGFQVESVSESHLAIVKGVDDHVRELDFIALPFVKEIHSFKTRFKLASRLCKKENTVITLKGASIGGGELFVCGGPCSIESEEQMRACARAAKKAGAGAIRGGAFKPRTSPYEFQGMGEAGLKILQKTAEEEALISISEVMDLSGIHLAKNYVDILQVGARNMQNFNLLKELGKVKNPILLKRGFAATYQELIMAAEYILSEGNPNVILCERGIRTFETHTRNTLDLNAVPVLKELTHLPILVDPSHATGLRSLVRPMSRAAVAAGADGLLIEMHPDPDSSTSDAKQTIDFETFEKIMKEATLLHSTMRSFAC
jgi:3-deoxy-7-phosphoheptulonate synthase